MEQLTVSEKADMHLMYNVAYCNGSKALYREKFPNRKMPGHELFSHLHRQQHESDSFHVKDPMRVVYDTYEFRKRKNVF